MIDPEDPASTGNSLPASGSAVDKTIAAGPETLSYWIDFKATILQVAGPWNTWLGHDGLIPDRSSVGNVVGSSLFSFIANEGVRHVYRTLNARVLETGRAVKFPFRCDSPSRRREMQMSITREGDTIRYDSTVVSETIRPRPLPEPAPAAATLVAMCSFCKAYRFPIESTAWKDVESLLTEPDLPAAFSVSHGLCEPCHRLLP